MNYLFFLKVYHLIIYSLGSSQVQVCYIIHIILYYIKRINNSFTIEDNGHFDNFNNEF